VAVASGYTRWVLAGNTSWRLDRVRAALADGPRSRREIAAAADVSTGYASQALKTLIELGEVQVVGARRTKGHPYLYALSASVVVQRG
jgi:hypothetical protein